MKRKLFFLSIFVISLALLTGCGAKSPSSGNPEQTSSSIEDQEQSVTLDQVLTAVGNAAGLGSPSKMVLKRQVDDINSYDDGQGFTFRATTDDPKFSQQEEVISQTLKNLGFSLNEYSPKNPASFVTKFIQYKKGEIKCTLEIRKVGTTGNSDLFFGCL